MGKKIDHTVFRNNKLFCLNCGGEQVVPFPIVIPMMTAMVTAFNKMHGKCEKTWKEPEANMAQSEKQRADFWWNKGERGSSSESIYFTMTGRMGTKTNHPYDPDDFRRCYLLLKMVPEWRMRIGEMKPVSIEWSNLADNWDKLTEMAEEQLKTGKPNGMYDFMQALIYPAVEKV